MKTNPVILTMLTGLFIMQQSLNCQINFSKAWEDTLVTNTWDVVAYDLDNDNDPDVFLTDASDSSQILFSSGEDSFFEIHQLIESSLCADIGDIDNDGDPDICLVNTNHDIKIWLNDGLGTFAETVIQLPTLNASEELHLAYLNTDTLLDIFVTNDSQPDEIFFNIGDLTFTKSSQTIGSSNEGPGSAACGDINGDGYTDIFKGYWGSPIAEVWLNNGSGNFEVKTQNFGSHTYHVHAVTLADFDGDSDLDAFIGFSGDVTSEIWMNDGTGLFTRTYTVSLSATKFIQDLVVNDFDNDGDTDIFVCTLNGNNALILNDGTGRFTECNIPFDGQTSFAAAAGDFDADNDIDIFISTHTMLGCNGYNLLWLNDSHLNHASRLLDDHEILIYTNPAQNTLRIEYPGLKQKSATYKIIDLDGKTVQHGKLTNNTLDVSMLHKGIYFLNLNIESESISKKILL